MMKTHGLMLGGGFIREVVAGLPPNDIDLLGPSVDRLKLAATELYHKRKGEARVLETDNAITHVAPPRTTVQFMTRWTFDDPVPLMQSFDFTVCQAVVYWTPCSTEDAGGYWDSVISDRFYPDLASRRLTYTQPDRHEDAGGSMLRMRKFLGRGYHIGADSLAAVMARVVSRIDMDKLPGTGEDAYANVIRGLLREVDPLLVIDGIEPVDIEHEAS
ncbi:hypothetical protein J7J47_16395 [Halomonas sp. ISL-60]|uniref:hypothetical protein n=1 Tax=Halomonas sp. ISL-56 TaxID=2819149 RepID=UPI001BE56C66|nr:hypothetical protein [Halomonas sp. ISL-56]MBT2773803.1 hypothetical protein [Halomonas sp. ISL-60]MBT2800013.1 hypothetical protein [Halomonas sp. ISL-56]